MMRTKLVTSLISPEDVNYSAKSHGKTRTEKFLRLGRYTRSADMSDPLRVMPKTLEIDQRVIRSLNSGGFRFALNAPPKTRRRARFSRRYRDQTRHEVFGPTGGRMKVSKWAK